ncbi:uncharacterized protein Tco025E_08579 [Trypanosoma conorhini]|uniref:Paraquat-inducible protein A n=1 Tax=Trypanosoma conorhini TaxID=83891 RepID=A0A3R7NEC0_9TRYP|nr:uncharacterized protein Tco025E_08579 [Trypanosoma conorhini]RNF01444.1 hypothetical protein Tco025E_08579 [Trypanosoma conorhini]
MFSTCFSLLFGWTSLLLTDIALSNFSVNLGLATLRNASCATMQIGATGGTFNASTWSLGLAEPSLLSCAVEVEMGSVRSRVFSNVRVLPSAIALKRASDDRCSNEVFRRDRCTFAMRLEGLRVEPPVPLLQLGMEAAKRYIEREAGVYACGVALPRLEGELRNRTVNPPASCPPFIEGDTPLSKSPLFRALLNILNKFPEVLGVRLEASALAETTIRLHLNFSHGLHMLMHNTTGSTGGFISSLEAFQSLLSALSHGRVEWSGTPHFPAAANGSMQVDVSEPFEMSLDVSFYGLRCAADGLHCSLPCAGGAQLRNIRLSGLHEWDRLVVNHIGPWASQVANGVCNSVVLPFCATSENRFQIPMKERTPLVMVPPTALSIISVFLAVAFVAGMICLSVLRHRRSPAKLWDGSDISLQRVLLEDTLLVLMIVVNALAFLWSNTTTAATLVVGDEMRMLSFSLVETTRSLYEAGLKPFAVLVFIFSGVYPYFKLASICVCTLVLQKPELVILRVIDYFGKLSFLDSYAMVIMAAGLQIAGIADVHILPGFYVFLAATILCILIGNYATALWRRNTSLRCRPESVVINVEDALDNGFLLTPEDEADKNISGAHKTSSRRLQRLLWRALNILFVAACILPVWVVPCLSYRVRGVASVLQPTDRNMTLFELASTSTMLLVTCVFTVGIAPMLYVVFYPRCALLASWGAADALLMACVAGLLQLGQFVEFIIGRDMNAVYTAEARLLWPLLPLLFSSAWQWVLAAEQVFGLSGRIKEAWAARGEAAAATREAEREGEGGGERPATPPQQGI